MRSLNISRENFENQRETVKEERRLRIDNQPYGAAFLTSDTLSYDYPPYSHTVIGKMADLDSARVEEVQSFFDRYYRPNNAVLTIVGDIDPEETMELVEHYFGDIESADPVHPIGGTEPEHEAERRMVIDDPSANVPAIFITYIIPPHNHPDTPAIRLLGKILTDGESSRMHRRLVKEEEAAFIVFGTDDSRKGPGLFRFIAASNIKVDIKTVEDLIYDEIEKLKKEGVTDAEVEKVKVKFKSDFVRGRQTVLGKAEALQHYAYFHKDLSEINTDLERFMAVTKEDILRAARKYFTVENRTVVIANPVSKRG